MTKDEIYTQLAIDNYYKDLEEYTDRLVNGAITIDRYNQLVMYAREFWLSINK